MNVREQTAMPRISYAQNGEDVVIWRGLGHLETGSYVDVGAADPELDSVTRLFYEHGWSGVTVEPVPQFAEALRHERPRDVTFDVAIGTTASRSTLFAVPDTGLSSLLPTAAESATAEGYTVQEVDVEMASLTSVIEQRFESDEEIHLLNISTEGTEAEVLRGMDFNRWKPWVIVVSATEPNGTADRRSQFDMLLTAHGYVPALFNGLKAFYVSPDHSELVEPLSLPPTAIDGFVRLTDIRRNEAHHAALEWKARWVGAQVQLVDLQTVAKEQALTAQQARRRAAKARRKAQQLESSPWWRVTAPGRKSVSKLKRSRGKLAADPDTQAKALRGRPRPSEVENSAVIQATTQRLAYICGEHGVPLTSDASFADALDATSRLLDSYSDPNPLLWLLHIAFTSGFPTTTEMNQLRVQYDLGGSAECISWLAQKIGDQRASWASTAPIRLVRHPIIDVSHTASYDIHTGIQRVVRETVRRWAQRHQLSLIVLDRKAPVWRGLSELEESRVLRWGFDPNVEQSKDFPYEILVPWETTVLLLELAGAPRQPEILTSIRNWSNSSFCALLYDMIPFSMSEACADGMPGAFSRYMTTIRNADRVSTISRTVAEDLVGFLTAVRNQGVVPPTVRPHLLPMEAGSVSDEVVEFHRNAVAAVPGVPVVLSVSSIEPRKNQTMTLVAAEKLWREGHSFQLVFIAGNGWRRELFDAQYEAARAAGRPVRVISQASEGLLWAAYRIARFSVFISLTEGFGLPAAESISSGTPVVLSNFGSMLEVGEDGGAELVDPRSLNDVSDAMRRLLTDDHRLLELTRQAEQRQEKTWDEYSKETWDWLVEGR